MSDKQDRTSPRTATDLERKYGLGKSFAEILGLVNDNRDKVKSVESSLKNEITNTETRLSRSDSEIRAEASRSITSVGDAVSSLQSKVEMKLDPDDVGIVVEKMISDGVEKVVTKTGYEFGSDGLKISKSGAEIENRLDHTGMYVKKTSGTDREDVLVANNEGVKAANLQANTYLTIGEGKGRSRFEDYGTNRTACFWVGGE